MPPSQHEQYGSGYGNDSWNNMGAYPQHGHQSGAQNPSEYPGYDYNAAPMPMEPSYTMNRPPPYAPASHGHMPPPLVMPQHNVWPSMLASSSTYNTPILPAAPIHTPVSAISTGSDMTSTSAKTSTSRRKLTDDERRLMCLEAENNPTMKQTQIGAKFNVERSTVSKILRQKDKYMKPQLKEEVHSPGKKPKVKLPDVEKTLANWARKQQDKGVAISNEELRKQVLMFSAGRSDQATLTNHAWIEKFKQKYLSDDDASPRADDSTEPTTTMSSVLSTSPTSSHDFISPPMSAIDDVVGDFKHEAAFDFEESPVLPQGMSAFGTRSEAVMSPTSPTFVRGHVGAASSFEIVPGDTSQPRQRSQTLPYIISSSKSRPSSADDNTPIQTARSTAVMGDTKSASVDPRQTMKRHKSVPDIHDAEGIRYSSMQPPPLPRSSEYSPLYMPSSPAPQDETFRALNHIKKMLESRPDVAEPDDYVMIGKLMEKLKMLHSPNSTPVIMTGGLRTMDFTESPRISKKRTMLEMS